MLNTFYSTTRDPTPRSGAASATWVGDPGLSVMTITDDDFVITAEREDELYGGSKDYNTAYGSIPTHAAAGR